MNIKISYKIEVLDPTDEGFIAIQVRTSTQPIDAEGNAIGAASYHREVFMPNHDATNDHATVRAICESIHNAEWKAKYQAKLDAEAAAAEAERVEQERIAAEAEAAKLVEEEAARIAEQERFNAAVAAALKAQKD